MHRRPSAPLAQIPLGLEKTGFLLEHSVAEVFRAAGWGAICNRYDVDDFDGRAREMDLVVYRICKSDGLDVVTCALVSCKNDATNTWAFMSRDKPGVDPNVQWEPVHAWTDHDALAPYLHSSTWMADYVHGDKGVYEACFKPERSVFGFQLLSADGKSPQNDKPIYDSISGLMKALGYELAALPNRQRSKSRLYFYTLLVVADAPLVDVRYSGTDGAAFEVEHMLHVARYMVNKCDLTAQIHFVRADQIEAFVSRLDGLAEYNARFADALVKTLVSQTGP